MHVPTRSETTTATVGQQKPPSRFSSFTKGTSSLSPAGVTSRQPSIPHDFAEAIRRRSSSIRTSVRATSMPPHSCSVPASRYWRMDSSVSCVISFEWSTGKMKFDACPVEPPGFGNGPRSEEHTSELQSQSNLVCRLLLEKKNTSPTRIPGCLIVNCLFRYHVLVCAW